MLALREQAFPRWISLRTILIPTPSHARPDQVKDQPRWVMIRAEGVSPVTQDWKRESNVAGLTNPTIQYGSAALLGFSIVKRRRRLLAVCNIHDRYG